MGLWTYKFLKLHFWALQLIWVHIQQKRYGFHTYIPHQLVHLINMTLLANTHINEELYNDQIREFDTCQEGVLEYSWKYSPEIDWRQNKWGDKHSWTKKPLQIVWVLIWVTRNKFAFFSGWTVVERYKTGFSVGSIKMGIWTIWSDGIIDRRKGIIKNKNGTFRFLWSF